MSLFTRDDLVAAAIIVAGVLLLTALFGDPTTWGIEP